MKKWLTILLLALALAGLVAGVARKSRKAVVDNPPETAAPVVVSPTVRVMYCTTNVRCPSCLKIEAMTRGLVEQAFAEDVRGGRLFFQTVNTDEPANAHFVDHYRLVSKTVVVSRMEGGREVAWENLQEVWRCFHNPPEFDAYVGDSIRRQLGAVAK